MSDRLNSFTKAYIKRLEDNMLLGAGNVDNAVSRLRTEIDDFYGHTDDYETYITALGRAKEIVAQQYLRIEWVRERSLTSLNPKQWYAGPGDEALIWDNLVERARARGRADDEIKLMDDESTAVLSLTSPPSEKEFKSLGMVVGHVQSGKTGNIAAVIAKAAHTPYSFFLVLSGLTTVLRQQTQVRLDTDLAVQDSAVWHSWTSYEADFVEHPGVPFQFGANRKQLAVLKKNAAVLRRFLRKLKRTPKTVLQTTPFIVIDDEADQASVNSARYETQMTAINKLIREIIDYLPRVSYIGYTATPYANVLIDPRIIPGKTVDLYPRNFIISLQHSPAYFGPERLFGSYAANEDADVSDDGTLDVIRTIPSDEAPLLAPQKASETMDFRFQVTPSLERALLYFLLALAARSVRGQGNQHAGMLIHTSSRIVIHRETERVLVPWLRATVDRLRVKDAGLLHRLSGLWDEETARVPASKFGYETLQFSQLAPELLSVAESIKVVVENSESIERLDFDAEPQSYIVVGGNVLSRGLTLEGLMVSFFLRNSNQYDTLMQMGRWFGYRVGYEDLPRVWMEDSTRMAFRDLAMVEAELREEILTFSRDQVTPEQYAVKVRRLPGMAITARNKMRAAALAEVSYSGKHIQTFRFMRDDAGWLADNWAAGADLVTSAQDSGIHADRSGSNILYRHVPFQLIKKFLTRYRAHPTHSQFDDSLLIGYIQDRISKADQAFLEWNVAVAMPERSAGPSMLPLGSLGSVQTQIRSSLIENGPTADIKALMSRKDAAIDLELPVHGLGWDGIKLLRNERNLPPLLLLYPINAKSPPSGRQGNRYPLAAAMDVLGMAIVFPGKPGVWEDYVSVRLPALEAEDETEEIIEVLEEMEDESASDDE